MLAGGMQRKSHKPLLKCGNESGRCSASQHVTRIWARHQPCEWRALAHAPNIDTLVMAKQILVLGTRSISEAVGHISGEVMEPALVHCNVSFVPALAATSTLGAISKQHRGIHPSIVVRRPGTPLHANKATRTATVFARIASGGDAREPSPKSKTAPGVQRPMRKPVGPYSVGVHDARLPDVEGGNRVRLFYPATPASASKPPRGAAQWLPRSLGKGFGDETILGVLRYGRVPVPRLGSILLGGLAHSKLPGILDAELLPHADASSADGHTGSSGWPLVMFSHGLAGSIAAYSILCIDMASRGYIVAAIEHSDGSSLNAFFGSQRTNMPYRFYNEAEDGSSFDFRNKQLRTRVKDLDTLLSSLRAAASEEGAALEPVENPQVSTGPVLRSQIDFSNVQVAGHS